MIDQPHLTYLPLHGPFVLARDERLRAIARCRAALLRHRDEVEGRENPDVCKEDVW